MAASLQSVIKLQNPRIVVSDDITNSDTGTTVAVIDVPAKTWIPPYGVSIYVETAFAGGTPSIDIGDGSDTDGWIDTTDITETTIGTYSSTAAAYAVTGKYYSAADTIDAVVSASLTAGSARVMVQMVDCSDIF